MLALLATLTVAAFGSEDFEGHTFYIGDPHHHSGISGDGFSTELTDPSHPIYENIGSFQDSFDQAVAHGLDWLAYTDHVTGAYAASREDWEWGHAIVLAHDEEATGLVVVPAAELYLSRTSPHHGLEHRNLYFFGDDATLAGLQWSDLLTGEDELDTVIDCADLSAWLDDLGAAFGEVLLIPHHPANLAPVNWRCWDEATTPAVEIYSGWGNGLGGPLGNWEVPIWLPDPSTTVTDAMDPGGYARRFAFWGGSDTHTSQPGDLCVEISTKRVSTGGLTVAVLEQGEAWSRATLHDAIVDRHTYASSGPLLPLVIELSSDGALLGTLGEEIQPDGGADVQLELRYPAEYDGAVLDVMVVTPSGLRYPDSTIAGTWSLTLEGEHMPAWFYAAVQLDGQVWYGSDTCDDGGENFVEWIWVSPTFVDPVDHDWDGDGWSWADGDCDEDDASIHPGATEIFYDGVDQDCDGGSDFDADGDGFEHLDHGGTDCDDDDGRARPGATEIWYDGIDQDCSGGSDFDADGDGHDSLEHGGDDCDDRIAGVHPGAIEAYYDGVDQDCDGWSDFDADADGFDHLDHGGTDCDDGDAARNPAAREIWYDGIDQDCSGGSDFDADGDGYVRRESGGTDCDDRAADVHPGARESFYDGVDQDCDGWSDFDADRDGYDRGAGPGEDCDDRDDAVHPGATERFYDGVDQDCVGDSDFDADGDGWDRAIDGGGDCDDRDRSIHPHAHEIFYDGVDQDCAGDSDFDADGDGFEVPFRGGIDCDDHDAFTHPLATEIWYDGVDQDCSGGSDFDADRDGFDALAHGGEDCDDADPETHPGGVEIWYDGHDRNCDGWSDYDSDHDGFDALEHGGDDCDDRAPGVHPDADEIWYDGVDQDCSGGSDYDADGDGWPHEQDCDDRDSSAWPGAPGWTHSCAQLPRATGCSQAGAPRGPSAVWLLILLGLLPWHRHQR